MVSIEDMCLTFEAPLPPRELAQNYRGHWAKIHRVRKDYRFTVFVIARQSISQFPGKLTLPLDKIKVETTWYTGTKKRDGLYRPRDYDNAMGSLKTLHDALVDAGIVRDDDFKHLVPSIPIIINHRQEFPVKGTKPYSKPRILVRISWEED